ncbi:MAG: hypothetical protein ABIE22_00845 [archaeon]
MTLEKVLVGGKEVNQLALPSGVIATTEAGIRFALGLSQLGMVVIKSTNWDGKYIPEGAEVLNFDSMRHANRESIFLQYAPGSYMNAVGLSNPGASGMRQTLEGIVIPDDKFLMISVFGRDIEEFVKVVRELKEIGDGIELNYSCPHSKKVGLAIGQDPELVGAITKAVVEETDKLVFAKLGPIPNIADVAEAAINAGAYGITAINTAGPGYFSVDGKPVLYNKVGGLSGRGIFPLALNSVRQIKQRVPEAFIIGGGGISSAQDIREIKEAGANLQFMGSVFRGMDSRAVSGFLETIENDLDPDNYQNAEIFLEEIARNHNMKYRTAEITKKTPAGDDFNIFETRVLHPTAHAGQYIMAMIPGLSEKPFSVVGRPLTIAVMSRGHFTGEFNKLEEGDSFYFRGPYGDPIVFHDSLARGGIRIPNHSSVVLVGGGCGVASLPLIAKDTGGEDANYALQVYLGAKNFSNIRPFISMFTDYTPSPESLKVISEAGDVGTAGNVGHLLEDAYKSGKLMPGSYFFNCGPRGMLDAVEAIEKRVSGSHIYSSRERMIRCAASVCGSCISEAGEFTCRHPWEKVQ